MLTQFVLPFLLSTATIVSCFATLQVGVPSDDPASVANTVEGMDPMSTYRYTSQGWQDSTSWRIADDEVRVTAIDYFHPLVLTLLLILAVLIAVVLTTGEEELSRMLGDD